MDFNNKEMYRLHAEFCKFMANAKRIEILFLLGGHEMCVEDIASAMSLRVPNVSQHLAIMREKGVVEVRREGNKMYYSIANPKTLEACTIMREAMVEQMEKQIGIIRSINKE